jgi:CysZ protein
LGYGNHLIKKDSLFTGIYFFWQGVKLVLSPRFKRFIIVPIIVNIFLLVGLIALLFHYFSNSFTSWVMSYPHWLVVLLGWVVSLIFWVTSLFISTFLFTILTNLIASPFYGLLAEKLEKRLSPVVMAPEFSLWKMLPHTLYRESIKIVYFIPWLLLCVFLFVFPPTMPLAPFAWWLILAWLLAIQYIDYCADNQQISFRKMITQLKQAPYTVIGFGGTVTLLMTIPGANLIVPPSAVAGGTALWLSLTLGHSRQESKIV